MFVKQFKLNGELSLEEIQKETGIKTLSRLEQYRNAAESVLFADMFL
jgi:hypothetical protein